MRSPTTALLCEIVRRRHTLVWAILALSITGWLVEILDNGTQVSGSGGRGSPLNGLLGMLSFLLLFGLFNYTESNERGFGRFPARLFTLPVSSLQLVSVPIVAGIVAAELLLVVWVKPFDEGGPTSPLFVGVLLAASMVFYQAVLWTLASLGTLRLIVLGLIATAVLGVGFLPTLPGDPSSPWHSEPVLASIVATFATVAFLMAWRHVARLRAGGGNARRLHVTALGTRVTAASSVKSRRFATAASAQLWFEWRGFGATLPLLVAALLVVAILPVSWLVRGHPEDTFLLLLATLSMPICLAIPIGIAYSKASFWSNDLSVPTFVSVRPLSSQELIAIKVKAAALSVAASWLLVLVFLSVWLSSWANLDFLSRVAIQWWAFHGRSEIAVYGIAALIVIAGVLLTWRFLLTNLWTGLSGNRRLYNWSGILLAVIVIASIGFDAQRLPEWVLEDPARMRPFVWAAALAVVAKCWFAVYSWREIEPRLLRMYLLAWCVGTLALVALALGFWNVLRIYLPVDVHRLQGLLVLGAVLAMPLGRIGLAATYLTANRHRS
jgi:hypothetical protein